MKRSHKNCGEAENREPGTGNEYSLFHSNVGVEHCSTLPQLMVSEVGCPNSRKSALSFPALSLDFAATSHMLYAALPIPALTQPNLSNRSSSTALGFNFTSPSNLFFPPHPFAGILVIEVERLVQTLSSPMDSQTAEG